MINRIRREHGIASSVFEFDYKNSPLEVNFFLYSEGRIAIPQRLSIIVEDLNTRQKVIFEYPHNTIEMDITTPHLEGQFLINTFTKSLPDDDEIKKKNNDNQICFFARVPPIKVTNFIFDPQIFVNLDSNQGAEDLWISTNRGSQKAILGREQLPTENNQSIRDELNVMWVELRNGYVPPVKNIWLDMIFYEQLIYNLSTRQFNRFNIQHHHTYQENFISCGSLFWNNQILTPVLHENKEMLQVITVSKGLSGIWNGSVGNDDYSNTSGSSIMRGETRSSFLFCPNEFYDGSKERDIFLKNSHIKVYGDDNFVIRKAGKTFKVWKFDEFRY
ncbi:hypothetical protein EPUL_005934, partial [Erysiphe pulchra]